MEEGALPKHSGITLGATESTPPAVTTAESKRSLTPKERIVLALNHKEPDKIPFDLGSTKVTGIHLKAYKNFISYLGPSRFFSEDVIDYPIVDLVQQLARPHEEVLRFLQVDTRGIFPNPPSTWSLKIEEEAEYLFFVDEWGITWRMPKAGGYYFDMVIHPLANNFPEEILTEPTLGSKTILESRNNEEDLDGARRSSEAEIAGNWRGWPNPRDSARINGLREKAKELLDSTKAAILISGFCAGFMEMALRLRGFENFFADLALEPKLASRLLDKILELKLQYWEEVLPLLKEYVLIVVESEDLGSQNSTLISPSAYRKYIKPRQKRLFSFIREKLAPKKVFIFLHSCGSILELIPDFIEVGVDILNPVQVRAAGMDTKRLKKQFGNDITFWGGGIDTQEILPRGTPQQVRDEVKRRIDDLAPGGGFVFCPVHNIQGDIPSENIIAMWETLQQYGVY